MLPLGQEIRKLRREKKLTQKDLAEKVQKRGLRCEFTYLSKIENNRLDRPPSEELIKCLAEILNGDAEKWLSMVGQFDRKALQNVIEEIPDAGVLLRKLQNKEFSSEQIREFLKKINDEFDSKS